MALSLTCRAFRDLAQSILFSRVEVGSFNTLMGLTGRDGGLQEEADQGEEKARRKELCAGIR